MRDSTEVPTFDAICQVVCDLLGTTVPGDVPLMGVGLDSLGASELITKLKEKMSIDIEPTALFDHPTIARLSAFSTGRVSSFPMSGRSVEPGSRF